VAGVVTVLVALRTTLVLAGLGLLVVGLRVYRTRGAPALRPFVVLVAVVGVLAVLDGLSIGNLAVPSVVWLLAYLAIPMSFAWFVVEYYGLSPLASRASRLAFLTPAALGLLGGIHLVLSLAAQGAMAGATSAGPARLSLLTTLAGFAEEAALYYATGTMLVGVALLVRVVGRYDYLDRRLAALLSFVPVWPWLAYFATPGFAGLVELGTLVGFTTAGYLLSLCAAVFAVSRGGLFEAAPAAGTLLADLDEAVMVVDGRGRVVRRNRTAADTFETAGEPAVGRPLTTLLGSDLDELGAGGAIELEVDGGSRQFEATVSAVIDRFGRETGVAVVLRDVTGERLRAQRLAVLNRVLCHDLRNGMTATRGRAAVIADRTAEHADSVEAILSSADDLVELGERARI
jgi:PAS domain-containing protein